MTPTETVTLVVTLNATLAIGFLLGKFSNHPLFRGDQQ